jgi:hypothetical protein
MMEASFATRADIEFKRAIVIAVSDILEAFPSLSSNYIEQNVEDINMLPAQ